MDTLDCIRFLVAKPEAIPSREEALCVTDLAPDQAEKFLAGRAGDPLDTLYSCRVAAFAAKMGLPEETALEILPSETMDYRTFLETVMFLAMREHNHATHLSADVPDALPNMWIDAAEAIAAVGWAIASSAGDLAVKPA